MQIIFIYLNLSFKTFPISLNLKNSFLHLMSINRSIVCVANVNQWMNIERYLTISTFYFFKKSSNKSYNECIVTWFRFGVIIWFNKWCIINAYAFANNNTFSFHHNKVINSNDFLKTALFSLFGARKKKFAFCFVDYYQKKCIKCWVAFS